jgi:hypothetical protein
MKKFITVLILVFAFVGAQVSIYAQEPTVQKVDKKGATAVKKGEKMEKKGAKIQKKGETPEKKGEPTEKKPEVK